MKPDFGRNSSNVQPCQASSIKTTKSSCRDKQGSVPWNSTRSVIEEDNCLLLDRHLPETINDVAVSKKKVEELQQWLKQAFNSSNSHVSTVEFILSSLFDVELWFQAPFLLLIGPSGSGKFQTLRLLCKELNIEMHGWEEQIRYESTVEWDFRSGTLYSSVWKIELLFVLW